ncbi:MAG: TIGR02147 family protein [Sandaracinaceae bacterium]
MARGTELDVFQYLDYRAFLREWYQAHNEGGRSFSFRAFSRRAGLKSPNYLKLVMDGERNLTTQTAERFTRGLGLEGDAASYFVDLVAFNQASTQAERNKQYARLTSFRGYRKTHKIDLAHAAYHSAWYMPVVREMAAAPQVPSDPEWIAGRLMPPISRKEAERALETLIELGMLTREDDGRLKQTDGLVSTGPEVRGLHIANYHRAMMERAAASIDLVAPEERDISALTLCVGEDGVRRLKARLQRFRRELLELSEMDDDPVRVVQINFQLFPMTSTLTDEGGE